MVLFVVFKNSVTDGLSFANVSNGIVLGLIPQLRWNGVQSVILLAAELYATSTSTRCSSQFFSEIGIRAYHLLYFSVPIFHSVRQSADGML